MIRRAAIVASLIVLAGGAYAESEAIAERQKIFKSFGGASKPIGDMLKGSTPFNLDTVKASFSTISQGAKKLPTLFPDDSKEGGKTQALPNIWTEKDKFNALFAKLDSDASAAAASITDEASFRANAPKVLGNCKTCHDSYRAKS